VEKHFSENHRTTERRGKPAGQGVKFEVATMKTGFLYIKGNHQCPDTPSFKTGMEFRSIVETVLGIAV
jgi:hypothetical protein